MYTADDLRHEAARQHRVLVSRFTASLDAGAVLGRMLDAPVQSTASDSDTLTWDEALNCDQLDEPTGPISDLIRGAADVSEWAILLGADGLVPSTDHALGVTADDRPIARVLFAYAPDVPDEARTALRQAIDAALDDAETEEEHTDPGDLVTARMQHAVRKYATALTQIEDTERERDGVYRERAHLVALLAVMTEGAVITPALDLDEPGWWIAYLTIGGRQCSWHIAPRDAGLFKDVVRVEPTDPRAQWDGHTTDEKYAAITAYTKQLTKEQPVPTTPCNATITGVNVPDGETLTCTVKDIDHHPIHHVGPKREHGRTLWSDHHAGATPHQASSDEKPVDTSQPRE